MDALPSSLSRCTHLTELNIESNNIYHLPDGLLAQLTNLTGLSLSRNFFNVFPPGGPQQFVTVQASNRWLCHQSLHSFPSSDFKTWTSLVELNLATNQLTKLPDDIEHLTNLEVLVLSNNQLKRIPVSIQELKKLRILDVEENNLDSIPPEIGNLPELQRLTVQSNKLTSLPSSIGNLSNLTYLAIAENDLHSLPPAIGRLKNLEKLYLNDNFNLHDLPPELAMCCGLQIMSIENCPLSKIPMEVVSQGPSLVIQVRRSTLITQLLMK
ncbi:unnamed protein product [Schistocephalus solidus]|uniref:Disease resistance R13L4/SHOC-2-like LRR domain-containing protein n=1 Tax=Schistocephalus solidus TaxID=70667 RepID=A0A3P7CFS1_SCHSO|nr:unnamed protein product [Schistocephalus solidus]